METIIWIVIIFALLFASSLYFCFIKDDKETANSLGFLGMVIMLVVVFLMPGYSRGTGFMVILEVILVFKNIASIEYKEYGKAYLYSVLASAVSMAIVIKFYLIG